jgi:hypothetical protein
MDLEHFRTLTTHTLSGGPGGGAREPKAALLTSELSVGARRDLSLHRPRGRTRACVRDRARRDRPLVVCRRRADVVRAHGCTPGVHCACHTFESRVNELSEQQPFCAG